MTTALSIATRGRLTGNALGIATNGWLSYAQILPPINPPSYIGGGSSSIIKKSKSRVFLDENDWAVALECMLRITN